MLLLGNQIHQIRVRYFNLLHILEFCHIIKRVCRINRFSESKAIALLNLTTRESLTDI